MQDIFPGTPHFRHFWQPETQHVELLVHEVQGAEEDRRARQQRGQRRAFQLHARDRPEAEDQQGIERDIENGRDDHQLARQARVAGCTHAAHAHHADDNEGHADIKDAHVLADQRQHVGGRAEQGEQRVDRQDANRADKSCYTEGQQQAVSREPLGPLVIVRTDSPRDDR